MTESVTAAHRAFYAEHGYVKLENVVSDEAHAFIVDCADRMYREALGIISDAREKDIDPAMIPAHVASSQLVVVPEKSNPNQVCRVEDMLRCYPEWAAVICPIILRLGAELLQEPVVPFKDKLNFKWPNGGGFVPHQDHPAYWAFPPTHFLTAMVCIDEATEENGCVQFPTNYKKTYEGDASVDQDALAAGRAVLPYDAAGLTAECHSKLKWNQVVASTCDIVLFDSFVPHYSEPNKSNKSRRAIFFTMNRTSEGNYFDAYYERKRSDPANPQFHFATPTARHGDISQKPMTM